MYSATRRMASSGRGETADRCGPTSGGGATAGASDGTPGRRGGAGWKSFAVLPALVILGSATGALSAAGQATERLTGLFAGRIDSEQVWNPGVETARRSGFAVGAFVDVPTPMAALRVRADGGFARRGGFVLSDIRGNALDGEVQSEYVTFQLQAKVSVAVGPVHVFAAGGPGFDYLIRSREDPLLAQVLVDKHATVFNVVGGAGAGVRIGSALVAEVEGRWVRGLSNAYSGPAANVRNRAQELVVRLSRVRPASAVAGGGAGG